MHVRRKTRRLAALTAALAVAFTGAVATISPTVTSAATGTNVALAANGGVATASGNEVADGRWTYQMAIDGDDSTRWSSNHSDTAWLQVELAEPTVVDHVNIKWEAACAARYKLQVSNDGTTWADATAEITPTCGTQSGFALDRQVLNDPFAGQAHSFVRMQALDRTPINGTKWGVSLYEFEVWDGPEPAPPAPPSGLVNLVPLPAQLTEDEGEPFVLNADTSIVASGDAMGVATLLRNQLSASTGFDLPIVASGESNVVELVLDPNYVGLDTPSTNEPYSLKTEAGRATITAKAVHGLYNGTQTLRQLFPPMVYAHDEVNREEWAAPAVTISDAPRFSHRGTQIDVARSFIELDEIKEIIDTLASVKISRIHLHLADDQGWRIEITNEGKEEGDPVDYTRLHRIGGMLSMAETEANRTYGYNQELGRAGYYTQDEYKELVQYAADRFITIVPEIDVPGHTGAMLHAIPELNSADTRPMRTVYGNTVEQNNGNVGESTLDVDLPQTWVSLRHIFGQLAEMTPGQWIHVGGDETHSTPHEDYNRFVQQVIPIIRDLGKSAIGWNEFAAAGLSEGDVVQYWVGSTAPTFQAIQDGAKVVVSASNRAYLDMKYTPATPIGLTWAGMGDLDHYYTWNPATVIPGAQESDLLGMEGPMWSETIRGGSQNEFMMFPRAMSHAEIGWTPQSLRDVNEFMARMQPMGARLLAQDRNFYDTPKVDWSTDVAGTDAKTATSEAMVVEPATIAAPGTKVAADGLSIAVDDVADADGVSNSKLEGPLSATIDFGDGSDPVPATFDPIQVRTSLHAGSRYMVGAEHTYATAGDYDVTVTFSDGRAVTSVVSVEDGYTAPAEYAPNECVAPAVPVASTTVQDNARLVSEISNFSPNTLVDVEFGGELQGRVMTDENGEALLSMPVVYQTVAGKYLFRVTDPDGRFVEQVIDVDSLTEPLTGRLLEPSAVTASSEALNETAPNGRAAAIIDGDRATFWHSAWGPAAPMPHTVVVDLGVAHELDWLTWVPRQGSVNGQVKDLTIEFSSDGETWTAPVAHSLPAGTSATSIDLDDSARYVRIVMTSNHSLDNPFATIGELEFRGLLPDEEPTEAPADPVAEVWEAPAQCGPDTTAPVVQPVANVTVTEGDEIEIAVTATDASALTYSAEGLPSGVAIDAATGVISGTATEAGSFPVVVTVTDEAGHFTTVEFTITIEAADVPDTTPPSVTPISGVSVERGKAVSIQVEADDATTPLLYQAVGLPAGVTINSSTGLISGTPAAEGVFRVMVTVEDAAGNEASQEFTISVTPRVTTPPVTTPPVTPPPGKPWAPSAPYTLPGLHHVNDRMWNTTCEPYSQTTRCRTDIWATVVEREGDNFTVKQGWAFNNLTYLPYMTRAAWAKNPLGYTNVWKAPTDGRQWRTECDTEATGRGACRSYTLTTVYAAKPKPAGGYTFSQDNVWVFNNMVLFKQ